MGNLIQTRVDGYRGLWYALGHKFEYGDKYSGGLGTYTANHQPMAQFVPEVNKTFFTYGGTTAADKRQLAIMVSYYDHKQHRMPRPVMLWTDPAVDDPHDNASLTLDADGHIWVFKSGRGVGRQGIVFRSVEAYSIDAFEEVSRNEFTYPQAWYDAREGFFLLLTKYTFYKDRGPARNLFWRTSRDGRHWSADGSLAAFGGHYQTSGMSSRGKISTFFNWHPNGDVDKRTNLYYAQTTDRGRTWTDAAGNAIPVLLKDPQNPALVLDLQSQGTCMYTCDLNFDRAENPILLSIISRKGEPGPAGMPRQWTVSHWMEGTWRSHVITTSDHNYDMGSLYVEDDCWRVLGPTQPGPQQWGAGGEVAVWTSRDLGATWTMDRQITRDSPFNHSYVRRPLNASDPFHAFWADGHANEMSKSHLYFCDRNGEQLFRLPYDMTTDLAEPEKLQGPP